MKLQHPAVSRSVIYVEEVDGELVDRAAIITGLAGDGLNVHLTVLPVDDDPYCVTDVEPSANIEEPKAATWHWQVASPR